MPSSRWSRLLRLLEPVQVGVEVFLLEPGRAVDALQHLPLLVAPPVRAGAVQQLEVLEPAVLGTCGPRHRSTNGPSV